MTRLIDADALRDKLQEEIDKAIPPFDDVIGSIRCGVRLARNIVEDEPTVDAVPVIRCKDCKHMGDVYLVSLPWLEQKEHRCRYWEHPTTPADYCSRAERKEE